VHPVTHVHFVEMNESKWEKSSQELRILEEMYGDLSDTECYSQNSADAQEMDTDLVESYISDKVEKLVKEHLSKHSETIIDLAIKAYILRKKNEKIERSKYTLKKHSK